MIFVYLSFASLLFVYSHFGFPHVQDDYVHAPNMYNITTMKNRKLKFGLGVAAVVVGGSAIPWVGRVTCTDPIGGGKNSLAVAE